MLNKRIEAVKLADAVNAIEGVPVRTYAKELSKQWALGKITDEQMKSALAISHRQLARQVRENNG